MMLATALVLALNSAVSAAASSEAQVTRHLWPTLDVAALRAIGPPVTSVLVALYEKETTPQRKAIIAQAFYQLGWKSEAAKNALLRDIATSDPELRLEVQWALGRVSNDDKVVQTLLGVMRHDQSPLFRDKAACALANDQIHLTPQQRFRMISGLIDALADDNAQVRHIAILALQIQTGQTKGFDPNASSSDRAARIQTWQHWLNEYERQL